MKPFGAEHESSTTEHWAGCASTPGARRLRADSGAPRSAAVLSVGVALLVGACGPVVAAGAGCREIDIGLRLPPEIGESSGIAVSLRNPGVFWTHNDSGAVLFAIDAGGALLNTIQVDAKFVDWEDIGVSTCAEGASCLYLADLGDNYERRPAGHIAIYRLSEPDPMTADTLRGEAFPIRLPDGPRDIEALLVFPGERVFAISKGRNHPVTVYRYPGALRPDTVTLEWVQELTERPRFLSRQVTGGAVDPLGRLAALRTYEALHFYRIEGDTLAVVEAATLNLRTLHEAQGEGVGIGLNGLVALTSEGGPAGGPGGLALLRCELGRL